MFSCGKLYVFITLYSSTPAVRLYIFSERILMLEGYDFIIKRLWFIQKFMIISLFDFKSHLTVVHVPTGKCTQNI